MLRRRDLVTSQGRYHIKPRCPETTTRTFIIAHSFYKLDANPKHLGTQTHSGTLILNWTLRRELIEKMTCLCRLLLLHTVVGFVLPNGHSSLVTALPLSGNAMAATSHRLRHRNGHRRPKQTEIELIKKDLIQKLGFDEVPDISKFNKTITVQEKRRMLKDYRKSLDEMKTDVHKLYEEEIMLPDIYHRIVDHGKNVCRTAVSDICIYTHIYTSPPEGVARYCFHPVCLSLCVCVPVCLCICVSGQYFEILFLY